MTEVMFTIRPNRCAVMDSITAWIISIGVTMFMMSPSRDSFTIEVLVRAIRWGAVVGDEDVGVWASREKRALSFSGRNISRDPGSPQRQ